MMMDENGNLPQWLGWVLTGVTLAGLTALTIFTMGAAAPITGALATAIVGATIGAYIGVASSIVTQVKNNGWNNLDSTQIFRDCLGGAVSGAISSLSTSTSLIGYLVSFGVGGVSSVAGGLVSGSVTSLETGILAFSIGGLANVLAKGLTDVISLSKASKIFNMSNKAKSLEVQQLFGNVNNGGKEFLKGAYRNAFKDVSLSTINTLVTNANSFLRLGIYSAITSSLLSTFPYIFIQE